MEYKKKNIRQSTKRIFAKTVIYRILGFSLMFLIVTFFSKDVKTALSMSILVELMQTLLYFSYENVWNNISWGIIT